MAELKFVKELKELRKDVDFLKHHMVDPDSIMTEEDYESLLMYREEKKKGKLLYP